MGRFQGRGCNSIRGGRGGRASRGGRGHSRSSSLSSSSSRSKNNNAPKTKLEDHVYGDYQWLGYKTRTWSRSSTPVHLSQRIPVAPESGEWVAGGYIHERRLVLLEPNYLLRQFKPCAFLDIQYGNGNTLKFFR